MSWISGSSHKSIIVGMVPIIEQASEFVKAPDGATCGIATIAPRDRDSIYGRGFRSRIKYERVARLFLPIH
jgi:hypothetical protein